MRRRLARFALMLCTAGAVLSARAQSAQPLVDRAVIRFVAPDLGGAPTPEFMFERELSFEARLQALADPDQPKDALRPYLDRHVRSAVERHIAESLLANLKVDPAASDAELDQQTESARRILSDRVGGELALSAAARAEGITDREVTILLRRQARAGLYLDRMVAPMLAPTRTELRQVYAVERHPFTQLAFDEAEPLLRRWWIGHRLADAVEQYYSNARQRVIVTLLVPSGDNSGAFGSAK